MSRLKVLIAEDEPGALQLMETSLLLWGYEPISAKDGAEAQTLLLAGGIHVCIVDWDMPKLDGIDLCKWIRSHCFDPGPYIVMLTKQRGSQHIDAGYAAGVDTFLPKPFDRKALRSRIFGAAAQLLVGNAPLRLRPFAHAHHRAH